MKTERSDRAVILARGESRRMGCPKGLAKLPGNDSCFLQMLLRSYRTVGLPVLVVTGPDGRDEYERIVRDEPEADLLAADHSGDTARSVALAWRHLGHEATHLWAHPVDLPEVDPATLRTLQENSRTEPERVIRPVWRRQPGHPVVLPGRALTALDARLPQGGLARAPGKMNDALAMLEAAGQPGIRVIEVEDPGVARDYDSPEDLEEAAGRQGAGPRPGGEG